MCSFFRRPRPTSEVRFGSARAETTKNVSDPRKEYSYANIPRFRYAVCIRHTVLTRCGGLRMRRYYIGLSWRIVGISRNARKRTCKIMHIRSACTGIGRYLEQLLFFCDSEFHFTSYYSCRDSSRARVSVEKRLLARAQSPRKRFDPDRRPRRIILQ